MSDFWTRRRAAVKAEAHADELALRDAEEAAQEAEVAERPDAELLAEAGMPEPESLMSSEEVQAFLKSGLPKRLKNRAMRRLWRVNPVLANLDGLNDYDDDYTDAATVVPDLQTVYRVGQGMLARLEELGATDEAGAQPPSEEVAALADAAPAPVASADPVAAPDAVSTATSEATYAEAAEPQPDPLPASARRMRFQFDTPEGLT